MKLFLTVIIVTALSLSICAIVSANCGGCCGCGGCKKGKVIEEEVTLDKCPEKVQETIKKEAEGGTIGEIEKQTVGEKVTYEAEITVDGQKYEVTVNNEGKLLSKVADDEEDDEEEDD